MGLFILEGAKILWKNRNRLFFGVKMKRKDLYGIFLGW